MELRKISVSVAPGCRVRHEVTGQPLPEAQVVEVPDSPYFRRRLEAGDLVEATPPAKRTRATAPAQGE